MKKCPLCNNESPSGTEVCEFCGYFAKENKIYALDKAKSYYNSLNHKQTGDWSLALQFLGRMKDVLDCSQREISRILDIALGSVNKKLWLLSEIEKKPELKKCRTKTSAYRKAAQPDLNPFDYEDGLQEHIYNKWNETPFARDWYIYGGKHLKGKFNTKEAGEMDLLAHHREENKWLVIELKKDNSSDSAVGQILRYMGWVKKKLAEQQDEINGIIICSEYDNDMEFSLTCLSNIEVYIYSRSDENTIEFIHQQDKVCQAARLLKNLSSEQVKRAIALQKRTEDS